MNELKPNPDWVDATPETTFWLYWRTPRNSTRRKDRLKAMRRAIREHMSMRFGGVVRERKYAKWNTSEWPS